MKIEKDCVVCFYYIVLEFGQELIESFRDCDLLVILIGYGNIILGLENVMMDKEVGVIFVVDVKVADVYGECCDGLSQCVFKKYFGIICLVLGQQVVLQINFGLCVVIVQKVGMSVVDVDLNYLMVGKDLYFDVEIVEVCEVSKEEIEYGYVYGDGGYQY